MNAIPFRDLHPREADERVWRKNMIAKSQELYRELLRQEPDVVPVQSKEAV